MAISPHLNKNTEACQYT